MKSLQNSISVTGQSGVAKKDLHLNAFRRVPAQVLNAGTKQMGLQRATALLRRLKVSDTKRVFFTDEKIFISTLLSAARTTEFGRAARKLTFSR